MRLPFCFLSALLLVSFSFHACSKSGSEKAIIQKPNPYWYQSKAEVNGYTLKEQRYGVMRDGYVVLIFVTEDFLTSKNVKNESYVDKSSVPVFKCNMKKHFVTGMYDYTLMSSVFSPANAPLDHPYKVSSSNLDWCGHEWLQVNRKGNNLELEQFSYFEKEADRKLSLTSCLQEDELFNLIRLCPNQIPTGLQKMLPSTQYLMIQHWPIEAVDVDIKNMEYKGSDFSIDNTKCLQVLMPSLNRELNIVYENNPPYKILGWTDNFPNKEGDIMKSIAKLKESMLEDYWNKNGKAYESLRIVLGVKEE